MSLPDGSEGKEFAYNAGDPGQEDPWQKEMAPAPVFCPEKPMDRGPCGITTIGVGQNLPEMTEKLPLSCVTDNVLSYINI